MSSPILHCRFRFTLTVAALSVVFPFASSSVLGGPATELPPIYDTSADGAAQIDEALQLARREHKRVLLQFGANWCIWCHHLHRLFDTNAGVSQALHSHYVLVLIDVDEIDGQRHNASVIARYGNPIKHGLPVLVVLDDKDRPLMTRETVSWQVGDAYDVSKVLSFLNKWRPPPVDAEQVLGDALAEAERQSKRVFVYFSAPWCGFCKRLKGYLRDEQVRPVFERAFVPVEIDVERMTGGKALADKYGRTEDDGVPFFAILDSSGKKLADSRGPQGNVGFPVEPFEVEHFVHVMQETGKGLTGAQLSFLGTALEGSDRREREPHGAGE